MPDTLEFLIPAGRYSEPLVGGKPEGAWREDAFDFVSYVAYPVGLNANSAFIEAHGFGVTDLD